MNKNRPIPNKVLLRTSFEAYRWGRHLMPDLIASLTCEEAKNLLGDLILAAPNSLAKACALRYAYTAERADETERRIQEQLPFHWEETGRTPMNSPALFSRAGRREVTRPDIA